jgi:hypothetical protein
MARRTTPVGARLAGLLKEANRDGLRWKDIPRKSESTMSALANDPGRRMADDTAAAIDEGMGWAAGTAWKIAVGEITDPVPRVETPPGTVGGTRQAPGITKAGDRGEGELAANERKIVGEAARLLAQVAELLAQIETGADDADSD